MQRLIAFYLLLLCTVISTAQTWVDVTSEYIINPGFKDNNNTGWTIYASAGSTATRCQAQEFWNGTWDIYQIIPITTAGQYRLSVQGYYRISDNSEYAVQAYEEGGENITCLLYANDDTAPISSIYSNYSSSSLNGSWRYNAGGTFWSNYRYYPNTMESGREMFDMGYYSDNSVTTTVAVGDQLRIGLRNETYSSSNWTLFTNWKLEWYGTEVKATRINLSNTSAQMTVGETLQLTASITPSNATFKTLSFSSNNESVASVNDSGIITAKAEGTATITAQIATGSSTAKATCRITVKRNEVLPGSIVINEIQQANVDMFVDPSFNYGGWIELYNPTSSTISLDGLYITDDSASPKKIALNGNFGVIPANGFKCIWFDHYSRWALSMVNFKLNADGGSIYIMNQDGNVIAQQDYPAAISRTSYARTIDGGNSWGYTDQPTPEATNSTSVFASTRLQAPVIDSDGGRFSASFTTHVTIPAGATLRYTKDGSTPTLTNGSTSTNGTFTISGTTILRLRLFRNGYLSSPVVTRSYIYNDKNYTLPVISLVSDNANLYGDELGIFVQGSGNGRPGNGQDANCNWNMSWDRPANIEFFTEDGDAAFNQEVAIEASGGWSRAWTPHSFNIKANKVFEGQNRLNYQFFEEKPFLRHKALKVRNGGNDTSNRIKDAAIQQVVLTSGLYVDGQCYKPVHVFHNGQYIGVLNLREPNNKHYAFSNYGLDDDYLDQFKMSPDSGYVQQAGTKDSWNQLLTLSQSASDPVIYNEICKMLDIEEYINYCSVEFYIGGTDWPQNNIKGFRSQDGGQFHFILFDTDGAFATNSPFTVFANKQYYTFDQLRGADIIAEYGNNIWGEIEFVTLFLNLLQNKEFKKQFADQFCIVAGSVFDPNRTTAIIENMLAHVNPAMALEGRSATSTANSVRNSLSASRQSDMVSSMASYLGLTSEISLALSSDLPEAALHINNLPVPTGSFSGKAFTPLTVQAMAPAGYRFAGWKSNLTTISTTLIAKGDSWNYYDQGSLDNTNWKAASYSSTWPSGNAPLGYFTSDSQNQRGYQTFLDYGSSTSNKYPTYYFRKSISLSSTPDNDATFTLEFVADDGFVIYVNGTEAGRYQMNNTPTPTFNSFADTYAHSNPDSGTLTLDAKLFKKGTNVIAVELHNNEGKSTDIYWDAALTMSQAASSDIVSTNETYTIPSGVNSITLVASYEPLSYEDMAQTDACPVKINEVSAANDIFVNEHFKKSDWIELYNTTDKDIDITGMYISDNLSKPTKYQITSNDGTVNTIIPAHGFLVVWADKLESYGQLHTGFKLDADSGCVMLLAADESWGDTLIYCPHNGYQTVGLYPDGSSTLYVMDKPTIGGHNTISSSATLWNEPKIDNTPTHIGHSLSNTNSSMMISYSNNQVTLFGAETARLEIFSTSGQLITAAIITNKEPFMLPNLPTGTFLISAKTESEIHTIKVHL